MRECEGSTWAFNGHPYRSGRAAWEEGRAGTEGDAEGSCFCEAGFGVLICSFFFSCSLGNFKGLCKQIDHFPEDADYEADTAEYFLRKSAGSSCNGL